TGSGLGSTSPITAKRSGTFGASDTGATTLLLQCQRQRRLERRTGHAQLALGRRRLSRSDMAVVAHFADEPDHARAASPPKINKVLLPRLAPVGDARLGPGRRTRLPPGVDQTVRPVHDRRLGFGSEQLEVARQQRCFIVLMLV